MAQLRDFVSTAAPEGENSSAILGDGESATERCVVMPWETVLISLPASQAHTTLDSEMSTFRQGYLPLE